MVQAEVGTDPYTYSVYDGDKKESSETMLGDLNVERDESDFTQGRFDKFFLVGRSLLSAYLYFPIFIGSLLLLILVLKRK